MKFPLLVCSLGLAMLVTMPAAAQSGTNSRPANLTSKQATAASSADAKDCSCVGTGCHCSCTGKCCICTCDGGCDCACTKAVTVFLPAGTTVNSAVQVISAAGIQVTIFAGGDQVLPSDISTTSWQALARLNMFPGVRMAVTMPDTWIPALTISGLPPNELQAKNRVRELRAIPLTEVISLCVHEEAGLPAALERLSRLTGYAFDVSGTPTPGFTLTAKGTVEEVVSQLSSAAGVTITIAH